MTKYCAAAASGQVAVIVTARAIDRKRARVRLETFDIKIRVRAAERVQES